MSPIRSWADLLNDAGTAGEGFEPLPVDTYDFVVSEASVGQSGNGKTMYKVRAKVEGGAYKDRLVFHNFVISPENPNALGMLFRQLGVLGLGREFFAANPSDEIVASNLVGKRFRGEIIIRNWNNQDRNEIKSFNTPIAQTGFGVPGPGAPAPAAPVAAPPAPAAPVAAPPAPVMAPPAPPAPVAAPPIPAPVAEAPVAPAPVAAPPAPPAPQATGQLPPPPPGLPF